MRLIQSIAPPFAPISKLGYDSNNIRRVSISILTYSRRNQIMKKNIIKLTFALSLVASAVTAPTVTAQEVVINQSISLETQQLVHDIFGMSQEMLKKAIAQLDAFFSKANNEPIKNHLIYMEEILSLIAENIAKLDAIILQQPPNSPDHQLLQATSVIVQRVQKGITQLKVVLENHQKNHGSGIIAAIKRTFVVSSLAGELAKVKKELSGDFIVLDQELTKLYNNLNVIYNNAILAGKLKAIQDYIQVLKTRKEPSNLAILAAITHRVNCQ
jgi:hypothetical protein